MSVCFWCNADPREELGKPKDSHHATWCPRFVRPPQPDPPPGFHYAIEDGRLCLKANITLEDCVRAMVAMEK